MEVRLTNEMFDALKALPEIPDYIAATIKVASQDGDFHTLSINDEERMSIEEMCQWHVIKDPETGKLPPRAVLYNSIIDAIYDADLS